MSKRQIVSHAVGGLNEKLRIEALDDSGPACRTYSITFDGPVVPITQHLDFQVGNPGEGVNGISNEALLAIVEDRLVGFQSSQFSCRENAVALTKIQEAMMWLQKRTRDRVARGVEGTQTV